MGIYPLKNSILPYAWGSTTAIASLMGQPVPSEAPQAELWMGAHPKAPSQIMTDGRWTFLNEAIENDPANMLGSAVANRFDNRLPYLFKVLAVEKPLSIQAHPNKVMAQKGFAKEERQNIPRDASHRNYRDKNHKPECICALTPFWALNGFKPAEKVVSLLLEACPTTLKNIDYSLKETDEIYLKRLMEQLLTLSGDQKKAMIDEALTQTTLAKTESDEVADSSWYWVDQLAQNYPGDIGVLAPLILNLVRLNPGEAMYLPSGRIHAYLKGTGLELMANSDNVLRGGLTTKHIDVDELLKVAIFEPLSIQPVQASRIDSSIERYHTPAVEFRLSKMTLKEGSRHSCRINGGAQIYFCISGIATVSENATNQMIEIRKGQSVFVSGEAEAVHISGEGIFYMASVPI